MNSFFDSMLDKTMQLLSIDSVESTPCKSSPFGKGVGDCIHMVLQTAESLGFKVRNQDGYYGVAEIGDGEEFGILGHVDVVPYDDNWTKNPLGQISDDKIYGRGILDDKGPMMCCLYACAELLSQGLIPKRKIKFIFGGNEETGWKCIEKYNELEIMPREGFSPDGDFPVINCEKGLAHYLATFKMPAHLLHIEGGSRGNIVMDKCCAKVDVELTTPCYDSNVQIKVENGISIVTAIGKPAHASQPQNGDNALWHVLKYLSQALGGEYSKLYNLLAHNNGKGCGLYLKDKKSGSLTFNVGVISSDNDKMKCLIDIRFPISYTKHFVLEKLKSNLEAMDVELKHYHDPHYIDKGQPLVKKLLHAYTSVTGEKGKPIAIGGGTYARAMECGVAFGPIFEGQESTIHQKDECVSMQDFKKMYEIYKNAIRLVCF